MKKNTIALFAALLISTLPLFAQSTRNKNSKFRLNFIEEIINSPKKYKSKGVFCNRAIETLSCGDCDNIEKVPGAGNFFVDESSKATYQLMHNGVKILKDSYYGNFGQWMGNIIHGLQGHHEPQEEKAFYKILSYAKPDDVMIELGSYWAYYSMWFKKGFPERRCILVEPSLERLCITHKNFKLNALEGELVWGYAGRPIDPSVAFKDVPYIDIEELMEQKNVKQLFMLHADIQGGEVGLLNSITNLLRNQRILFCFISTHSEKLHQQCLKLLEESDMIILASHTKAESYSCDGLIVAKHSSIPRPKDIKFSKKPKEASK